MTTSRRHLRRRCPSACHRTFARGHFLESLEDRRLLTIDLTGVVDWLEQGSQPITQAGATADPNNPASGAVEDLAIDPNDPSHMFAATVNGGIWRTHNGDRPFNGDDDGGFPILVDDPFEQPSWTPLTDQYGSLGMGGIAFDPLDVTGNTVFAGTGSSSSLSNAGGLPIGIMKTTDDGATWSVFPLDPGGTEPQVRVVVPTTYDSTDDPAVTQVVLVGTVGDGLYRSIDAGETYTQISSSGVGLLSGAVTDIIVDPNDDDVYYAGVVGRGVYRSDDGGSTWSDVNNADLSTNAALGSSTAVMLTAHPGGGTTRVYAMISYDDADTTMPPASVPQVFNTTDDGVNWTELATVTAGFESRFGDLYTDMASDQIIVDPSDETIVYIAKGYGGSIVLRYDPSGAGSWDQIDTGAASGNTKPHADHRDLLFVNSGGDDVLIDANDGGLYFFVDPKNTPGEWVSLHGFGATGLGVTENTNVTLDSTHGVLIGGAQDNGTSVQISPGSHIWESFRGSDGGDVQAADAGGGNSYRYSATQPGSTNPNQSPIQRHEFSDPTTEVGAPVNLFPAAGLTGFTPRFVAQFELNSVNASRLVVGGGGTMPVYELANADTATGPGPGPAPAAQWTAVPVGAGFNSVNDNDDACIVAGGRMGGSDNEEVLIACSGDDIFIRSTAGGTLTVTPTAFPGGTVEAVATDPENWQHIFVADSDQVWESPDAGNTWTEVTGNLATINSQLQSLAYVPTPDEDVILVGGYFGVSRLTVGVANAPWTRLGANLPNALVNDLEYHASDDLLLAGTFGRGAWIVEDASSVADDSPVLTVCGDEDHVNQDDLIQLVRNTFNPMLLDVYLNSVAPVFTVPLAIIQQINVFGIGGNDTLNVDSSFGLINVPSGIRYDGDGACPDSQPGFGFDRGFDTLVLDQSDGDTQTTDTYSVGPAAGAGSSIIAGSTGVQTVFFEELEPVVDLVPATDLVINGTAEPNLISYTTGPLVSRGLVAIDSYETIEFTAKDRLTINAGPGDDTVLVSNNLIPTGLTQIAVNADDDDDSVITRSTALLPQELSGGNGTDYLVGGLGTNTITGGDGFDTIGILGTPGNNAIDVRQDDSTTLMVTVDGNTHTDTFGSVEAVRIDADNGDDILRVTHDDSLIALPNASLPFDVFGGNPNASDRLAVRDDGIGDTVIYRKGADDRSGSVTVGPLAPVTFGQIEFLDVTPLDSVSGGTGTDANGQLVVFKPDPFENNNALPAATFLGAGATINVDPVIDPGSFAPLDLPGDQDWFEFVAAETGVLDFQVLFEQVGTLSNGRAGLPGDGDLDIEVYDVSGDLIASSTSSSDTERVTIGAVRNETYFLRVYGSGDAVNVYNLTAINLPAPVPFQVDLQAASDSGRNDTDDITNDTTPTFDVYVDDDRLEEFTNIDLVPDDDFFVELYNNGVLLGTATFQGPDPGVADNSRWEFTAAAGDLQEGHNNFVTAAVRIRDEADPRVIGRGEFSAPVQITLDTIAPNGTVNLHPDSDSGVWGFPATMDDLITTDQVPLLYGAAEADALVRVALDIDADPPNGTPDGTAVALPYDGDEAFPPPPEYDGNYFLQTILNLSDGEHTFTGFFRDVAGNETPANEAPELTIFIDSQGPKITNVTRGEVSTDNVFSFDGVTSLFEPKPSPTGPDPLIHSIVVHLSDLPDRTALFPYDALLEALAAEEGNYQLVGDHNGNIAVVEVNVMFTTVPDDGFPEEAEVELVFDAPLPDDRYTLWVEDSIADPAGNPLDGESGAQAPFDGNDVPAETPPIFPTGDGAHGGDFHGRFTIDSRPEIGTFAQGTTYVDINGNFVFDPEGKDRDSTNRDIAFVFGFRDDRVFAGNFAAAGAVSATGYDKLGAYGNQGQGAAWHWRLDFDHDGVVDYDVLSGVRTEGDPVAGNFSAAHPGDEIGLFNAGKWWLDAEGDNNIGGAGDLKLQGDMRGQPIVGDFDGDGLDDLGTWNAGNAGTQFDGVFEFDLANNGLTGDIERTIQFDLPGVFQFAVAADMNGDGIDDIGLFVTRREAVPPAEAGEWFFLISDVLLEVPGEVSALNHSFAPVPFGDDLFAQFGDEAARPVVGNFDPPSSVQRRLLGDVNYDGLFDSSDLVRVFQAGKYEDGVLENATFEEGDWNGDGDFDSSDLVLAFKSGSYTLSLGARLGDMAAAVDWLFAHDDLGARRPAFVA